MKYRSTSNDPVEREPLLRGSQVRGQKLWRSNGLVYHPIIDEARGRYYLCGCMKAIRGITGFSKLAKGRRKDWRWADIYRCYGRRPDRKDRW